MTRLVQLQKKNKKSPKTEVKTYVPSMRENFADLDDLIDNTVTYQDPFEVNEKANAYAVLKKSGEVEIISMKGTEEKNQGGIITTIHRAPSVTQLFTSTQNQVAPNMIALEWDFKEGKEIVTQPIEPVQTASYFTPLFTPQKYKR